MLCSKISSVARFKSIKLEWDERKNQRNLATHGSDIPSLSEEFFAKAQLRMPKSPVEVAVQVDPETFAWFQAQGASAKEQMSVALKIYAAAHKAYPKTTVKPA